MDAASAPAAELMPPVAPWEDLPEGTYAIVELMGHTTLVGRVTEIEKFGAKMMGIEVLFAGQLLPAVLQGGPSIYRFTPCSPKTAWKGQCKQENLWRLPDPIRAIVPAALLPAPDPRSPHAFDDAAGIDDDPQF